MTCGEKNLSHRLGMPGAILRPLFSGFRPATSCNIVSDLL